jgi:hypothetical protein
VATDQRISGEDLAFDLAMVMGVGSLLATSVALAVASWWPMILFAASMLVLVLVAILTLRSRR